MSTNERITGVLSPVVTPFKADLSPDPERLVRQCRWLLSQDVGLAVFGTNSEGNSLALEEKVELLDHLVGGGVGESDDVANHGVRHMGRRELIDGDLLGCAIQREEAEENWPEGEFSRLLHSI